MTWWVPAVWLFLVVFEVLLHVSKHGERRGEYDGPVTFITGCLMVWLFWYGGFFTVWTAP